MKSALWIAAVGLLLAGSTAAYAACATHTLFANGRMVVCTTCCAYGNCTTTCY